MKSILSIAAASGIIVAQASWALAQTTTGGPGTAGAGNAAAASGGVTPTQPGTGPGTTNPGNINVPPPDAPAPPAAGATQAPPPSPTVQSTTPPSNRGTAAAGGGTVGQSGRTTRLQDPKEDPEVRESEEEVSRRINSICKGC